MDCFKELSDEETRILANISTPRLLRKKEKLVEPGQPFNHLFILTGGLLRFFFDDENGVEINTFLPSEKEVAFLESPASYSPEGTRKYTIQAVIDSQIILFNKSEFEQVAFQHKGIYSLYLKSLKQIISILSARTEQFCRSSPLSRYEDFLNSHPFVCQNANRKYIANFLGITPNSLSRITARDNKKKNQGKK
ncbi:Crp/Fnr family transcriptional regulator [Chryseobacterium sp. CBSDS_008]|uniref:Crp/Fnr family transcriptional regulator n=1 Tax=Chryseobacterium sp. CBSDS_008 TaxID=3415265 RepID=UPI003CE96E44